MTPLTSRIVIADHDFTRVQRKLARRFYGPWPRVPIPMAAAAAGLASLWLLTRLLGEDAFPAGGIRWVLPFLIACLVWEAFDKAGRCRLMRAEAENPFRKHPSIFVVSPAGVDFQGVQLTWRQVLGVELMPDATLLVVSPLNFIPLLHSCLPPKITPATLHSQIAACRAGAAA